MLGTGYVAASILVSGFYMRTSDMKLAVMRGLSYLSYTKCVCVPCVRACVCMSVFAPSRGLGAHLNVCTRARGSRAARPT